MLSIDKLSYHSRLRYVNAKEKFAFAVITLFICVMSRSAAVAAIVLAATGFLTVSKGGVPALRYLRFLSVPLAFLLLSTLAIVLHLKREPLDLFAISIGDWYLTGGRSSLMYALRLILTALGCVSCLYFLAFTTPVPDILDVLNKLHCPKLFMELMLLIYRFVFVLWETASSISASQACRLGTRDYKTSLKSFGLLGAALMMRAISRSNQLYEAMEARCYDGSIDVLSEFRPSNPRTVLAIILFEAALLLFAVWRRFLV